MGGGFHDWGQARAESKEAIRSSGTDFTGGGTCLPEQPLLLASEPSWKKISQKLESPGSLAYFPTSS